MTKKNNFLVTLDFTLEGSRKTPGFKENVCRDLDQNFKILKVSLNYYKLCLLEKHIQVHRDQVCTYRAAYVLTYVHNAGFSFKCVKGKKNEKVGAFGFI